jgi:DNA-binding response OmpR family regulator
MSPPPARRVVLIVDDEAPIVTWLNRALHGLDYDVVAAVDNASAELVLEHSKVDAIILDLGLVGHSGLELLEFVRKRDNLANLPVLILTGMLQLTPHDEESIRQHRAHLFHKPVAIQEIAATLARVLSERAS